MSKMSVSEKDFTEEYLNEISSFEFFDRRTSFDERSLRTKEGTLLVPQPSSDPEDPLNWTFWRKAKFVSVISVSLVAGYVAPFCGQLNLTQQSILYGKTTVQITYANSAASAGLATGGFLIAPLAHKFGRSSVILWSLFGSLAAQIWGSQMTGSDQYVPYILSRYVAGFFGFATSVVAPSNLFDIFYLHQRGRAFTILEIAMNLGASAGPTFSGFIAANQYWTTEYWWTIALLGAAIVIVFTCLEETGYDRKTPALNPIKPTGYWANRVATFLPGSKVVKKTDLKETVQTAIIPFKIAIAPVVLLIAGFDMISFGYYVALNALTPVFLQKPIVAGGYGFIITQNALFTLVHWIGLVFGFLYGQYFSDRIPLWFAARNSGVWKPEYRLHALWLTSFVLQPIGLGLIGAALQYHLHWSIFAVGQIFVTIGCMVSIPVTINYILECFKSYPVQAVIPVNSMRLFVGLTINFFVNQWIAAVGIGWVYGMMALFTVFSFGFLIVLMCWGKKIRSWTPFGLDGSDEGATVVGNQTVKV